MSGPQKTGLDILEGEKYLVLLPGINIKFLRRPVLNQISLSVSLFYREFIKVYEDFVPCKGKVHPRTGHEGPEGE